MLRTLFHKPLKPAENITGMVLLQRREAPALSSVLTLLEEVAEIIEVRHHESKCLLLVRFPDYRVTIAHLPLPVLSSEIPVLSGSGAERDTWAFPPESHGSHLLLHMGDCGKDPLRENLVFSRLAAGLLPLETTGAVYLQNRGLLVSRKRFLMHMEKEPLPLSNWIFFGSHQSGGRRSVYTIGMKDFGKHEIEILDSSQGFEQLERLLSNVVKYIIQQRTGLRKGESLASEDYTGFGMSLEPAVYSEGKCLRINF